MRKMIVKKKVDTMDELKLFIDEALIYAADKFGWDKFIASASIEDGIHTILIVEKEI